MFVTFGLGQQSHSLQEEVPQSGGSALQPLSQREGDKRCVCWVSSVF